MERLTEIKESIGNLNTLPPLIEMMGKDEYTLFECGCGVVEMDGEKPSVKICDKHSEGDFLKVINNNDALTILLGNPVVQSAGAALILLALIFINK